MKCPINQKDFRDKEKLGKLLNTALKKPLNYLNKNNGERLPFYYEYGYISDKESFLSIGIAKEIHKIYKKRVKGSENGEKIDKKKVAFGEVFIDEFGMYNFIVRAGMMKPMEAKKAIKSINFLKKNIGDSFEILKGDPISDEEMDAMENMEATDDSDSDSDMSSTASSSSDVTALAKKVMAAYAAFRATELAAFAKQKNSETIKAVLTKGKAISKKMDEVLGQSTDDLQDDLLSLEGAKSKLDDTLGKIEAAVKSAQDKKSNVDLGVKVDSIREMLDFIKSHPELTDIDEDIAAAFEAVSV